MIQGTFKIDIGDVLILKKKHPCGSFKWEVTRIGADIKLKCSGCGHVIMLDRAVLRKKVKKIITKEVNE
jgi:hypothetical protein